MDPEGWTTTWHKTTNVIIILAQFKHEICTQQGSIIAIIPWNSVTESSAKMLWDTTPCLTLQTLLAAQGRVWGAARGVWGITPQSEASSALEYCHRCWWGKERHISQSVFKPAGLGSRLVWCFQSIVVQCVHVTHINTLTDLYLTSGRGLTVTWCCTQLSPCSQVPSTPLHYSHSSHSKAEIVWIEEAAYEK